MMFLGNSIVHLSVEQAERIINIVSNYVQ